MKVLKFGAVWCPGCIIMRPRWREIEQEQQWLKTEYYDYDSDTDMVTKYRITNKLPVCIFLDTEDNELKRLTGEVSKQELLELILQFKNK